MARDSSKYRQSLFELHAASLSAATGERGVFACPLCLERFTHADAMDRNLVSLEDCPPKSVGGKPRLLLCRKCNNRAGERIDNHLANQIRLHDFIDGRLPRAMQIRTEMEGIGVSGKMRRTAGSAMHTDYAISGQYSHEENVALWAAMAKAGAETEVSMFLCSDEVPDTRLANLACVKAGYLLAFLQLGYDYILQPYVQPVRDQVADPAADILLLNSIVQTVPESAYVDTALFLEAPTELCAVVMPLRMKLTKKTERNGYLHHRWVVLPRSGATMDAWRQATSRPARGRLQFSYDKQHLARDGAGAKATR